MAKKALCIGINDYPGTQNDLSGCVNDANDWAAALAARGFAVAKMLDSAASKAAMVEAIGGLVSGAAPNDTVVITYSGHGTWAPDQNGDEVDGRDEALCPWDLMTQGPLLDDQIAQLFAQRKAGVRVLLISDSCHSGSVTRGNAEDADPSTVKPRFLPPEVWMDVSGLLARGTALPPALNGLKRSGGDLLLAGCQDSEYSYDASFGGRPNGAFTYYALKTLATLPATATYTDWFKAIRSYLPSTSHPQTPQFFGGASARRFEVLA